ncbi:MAG: hypothetical protein HYS09_03675 [Chloroflexi bacterium]|nr:hypothetical protein [Chloroflexota bacterium]
MARRKLLEGAGFVPNWTSVVGAVEGVLRYLGHDYPTSYLMGVTGHAFRLDVDAGGAEAIGPAGPLSVGWEAAAETYSLLGRGFDLLCLRRDETEFDRRWRRALDEMKRSIDRSLPVIASDLFIAEFGVVFGYDDREKVLLVDTVASEQVGRRLPYDSWPSSEGLGRAYVLLPSRKAQPPDPEAERQALRFAVVHAERGEGGDGGERHVHGLKAYERWAEALEGEGPLSAYGNAYQGQVVQSARRYGAEFLRALAPTHPAAAEALSTAAAAYDKAVLALTRFTTLFPFPHGGDVQGEASRRLGALYLRRALAAEREAVEALKAAADK